MNGRKAKRLRREAKVQTLGEGLLAGMRPKEIRRLPTFSRALSKTYKRLKQEAKR